MEELGIDLEKLDASDLGRAKKVTITKDTTTIVEGGGKTSDIQGRIEQIKAQIDASSSDYDAEKGEDWREPFMGQLQKHCKVGASGAARLRDEATPRPTLMIYS